MTTLVIILFVLAFGALADGDNDFSNCFLTDDEAWEQSSVNRNSVNFQD